MHSNCKIWACEILPDWNLVMYSSAVFALGLFSKHCLTPPVAAVHRYMALTLSKSDLMSLSQNRRCHNKPRNDLWLTAVTLLTWSSTCLNREGPEYRSHFLVRGLLGGGDSKPFFSKVSGSKSGGIFILLANKVCQNYATTFTQVLLDIKIPGKANQVVLVKQIHR